MSQPSPKNMSVIDSTVPQVIIVVIIDAFKDMKRGKIQNNVVDVLKDARVKAQGTLLQLFPQRSLNRGSV